MKRLYLIVATLLLAVALQASPVSRSEASKWASSFLKQPSVVSVDTPFDHLYVFNGDHGFVILSDDDAVIPVLGYSFENPFGADMAESTREWLQAYDCEIQVVRDSGIEASEAVKAAWNSLKGDAMPLGFRSVIAPLIATTWQQYPPYNQYCPGGSLTGCVATGMSQIMRYWEYPSQGNGSHTYTHPDYGELSANFGETSYDWAHMPFVVTNASLPAAKQAVATLMYHCGVAVETNYGTNASSASSSKVIGAMTAYFGYASTMAMVRKSDFTDAQWKQLLRGELDAMRPLFYVGQDRASAHAFICDGYDEQGCFHFNWGWGGVNDGYYAIGSLNPGTYGPFNVNNYAIIGIEPAGGGTPSIPVPVDLDAVPSGYDMLLTWGMPVSNLGYSYKVSRNGVQLASDVTHLTYTDQDVPSGAITYQVWTVLNGVDSERKATYEVELARIDAVPADPLQGTVTGWGVEELDFLRVVKAIPNPGFTFLCWREDGEVVSTQAEYRFNVEGDRHLTAYFSGLGVDEESDEPMAGRVEVFSMNGVLLETREWNGTDRPLQGYAKGVYLLRMRTERGVVTRKLVLVD